MSDYCVTTNKPAHLSITWHKDESYVCAANMYPFFSVSLQRVSLAAVGGIALLGPDLMSQHALLPLEVVNDGNQIKHTKTRQLLRITGVPCGLRQNPLSTGLLASDVALSERWPMITQQSILTVSYTNSVGTPAFPF